MSDMDNLLGDNKIAAQDGGGELEGAILADYIQGDYKLSMWIPGDSAGRVVGRKGVVITNLQTETKARQINALSAVGDSLWVAVVIIGDWKSITAAYHAVSEIVNGEVDDVVLEFHINTRKPFFIYGKSKFNLIKLLSAKSNVRIFMPELGPKDQQMQEKLPPMTLEGSFDDVKKAVILLESEASMYRERYGVNGEKRLLAKQEKDTIGSNQKFSSGKKDLEDWRKDDLKSTRTLTSSAEIISKKEAKEAGNNVQEETPKQQDSIHISNEKEQDKDHVEAKQESPVPIISDSPVVSVAKRMGVEKVIHIPSSIVGLLLSKRPPLKATVMNQIQSSTNTIISKMIPVESGVKVDETTARRKESIETIETLTSEAKSSLMEDGHEDEDTVDNSVGDELSVDSSAFQDTVEVPDNIVTTLECGNEKRKDSDFVVFRISGFTSENVDAAYSHLDRIVKGERIKDVMEILKSVSKTLPRREIVGTKHLKEYKDRDRKPPLEKKLPKDKRNSKSFDKPSTSEKISEKEGVWRKEKLSDKPILIDNSSGGRPRRPVSYGSVGSSRGPLPAVAKEREAKVISSEENQLESGVTADSKTDPPSKKSGKFVKRT